MKIFFIFDWQLNLIFWFNYRNERLYNDFSKSILLSSSSTWMKVNYRASKNPLPFSKFHSLPFRIRHRPFHSLVISKKKPGLGETWKISSGESLAMLILLRNPRCLEGDDVSYSTLSWLKYPLQFFFFSFFQISTRPLTKSRESQSSRKYNKFVIDFLRLCCVVRREKRERTRWSSKDISFINYFRNFPDGWNILLRRKGGQVSSGYIQDNYTVGRGSCYRGCKNARF